MVTVNTCTTSATSVLKLIADKIGQATDGRRSAVMQELISQLSGSNRLIIIDEADRLSLQAFTGNPGLKRPGTCGDHSFWQ